MTTTTKRTKQHDAGLPFPVPGLKCLAFFLFLALVLLGQTTHVGAGTIQTGPLPIDTVIRPDGSAAYVVDQMNSTLTILDPATNLPVGMIVLGLPPGTAMDMDWHVASQQLHIGCNNGTVLAVDPATTIQTVLIANPAANYVCITSDNRTPGTLGWGIDATTGWLHQFLPAGVVVPIGPVPAGISVELIEKQADPLAATAFDDYLLLIGTGVGNVVTAQVYDRFTATMFMPSAYVGPPATAGGITSSTGTKAYVAATDVAPVNGRLLQFDFATNLWTPAPLATFPGVAANDVSMSGQFTTVLLADPAGLRIRVFDAADPVNVLDAGGALINPGILTGPVLDTWVGPTGDLDSIYVVGLHVGGNVTGQGVEGIRDLWINPLATSITSTGLPKKTHSHQVLNNVLAECWDCPPKETLARGGIDGHDVTAGEQGTTSIIRVQYGTGEEARTVPILTVPGVGIDLDLTLTYRSRSDFDYRYGQGWSLNQDVRLRTEANGDKSYSNGYGRLDVFTNAGGGTYLAPLHYDTAMTVGAQTTTITNRFGTVSTFDASGYRTSIQDRYGNTISYSWVSDKLMGITDTLGRSYSLAYDATGRLSSITDFGSRTWTFVYDYLGQLRTITTPATTSFPQGRSQWFSYSGNNMDVRFRSNLQRVWSPKGDVIQTLVYDGHDRVIEERVGNGVYSISYAKPVSDLITTVVDRSGNTFEWTFGSLGMPTKKEVFTRGLRQGEPTSYVTSYSINQTTGLVDYVVHPRGNRTDYTYDANLNLTQVRRKETNTPNPGATDIVSSWAYGGAFNQMSQSTDPRGNTTTYTVDGWGNTTQISHPTVTSPASQTITETFTFDGQGRILTATDGTNRSVALSYYASGSQKGYLQSVTRDPTGLALQTSFSYNQFGAITSVTDARGNTTSITVDAENFVTEIQAPSPLSYRRRIFYDENRSVTSVEVENIDRKGVQDTATPWIATSFEYDVLGRLTEKTVQLTATTDAVTTYDYDGSGNLIEIVDPEAHKKTFDWDERHLLWKATMGEGSTVEGTIELAYDLNGSLVTQKNPRGYSTTYAYDLFDRRTKVTNAQSGYTDLIYDAASNLTTAEAYDAQATLLARTTRYFDEVDRLWKTVQDRFGPGLTASYPQMVVTRDAAHRVTQVQDPLLNVTTYTYDTAGRMTRVTDAAGNYQDLTLDANGNVTTLSVTDLPAAGGSETFVTEFDYDKLNRRVEQREIDRLNASNILTTTFEYDSRSNLTFRTDAEGSPVRWNYDLASRMLKYERALQVGAQIDDFVLKIEEAFAYDGNDRLKTITDDNFNSTSYLYDARGRRTRTTYADSKYVVYSHDVNGNLSGWTDQNGTVVQNTHDTLDRLVLKSVTKGTGVLGSTFEQFGYDALGRMLTAVDDDYQVERTFDSVGNLLEDKQGYNVPGSEQWKSVKTTYTDAGSVSNILYPSTFSVQHNRDSIHRMTAMQDVGAATNIATFTWQGAGRLATTSNQNGTGTDYTWDGFGRIQAIDHTLASAQTFHKLEYAYDKVHNRRMEKNSFDAAWMATLPTAVQTFLSGRNGKGDVYAYDMAYRLVDARYDVTSPLTEVQSPGTQTFVTNIAYTLDGLGNRSQVQTNPPTPPASVTYAADVVNQYTSVGGVGRTHDNNGNLKDDGNQVYGYDFENRLVEVRQSGTQALIATYQYDALGRRVQKVVPGGATTRYVLDGVEVVEEFDGSGIWQARYVYEDGIDRPRCMDRADIADVNGNANTTEVLRFHYHQQALGSVTEITQPTGAAVEWVTYDVYGQPRLLDRKGTSITQSAVGNPYLYTGREYDAESGLYFYRARQYEAGTGRFLQRDPLSYVDGLGLYEYCESSAAVYRDPRGEETSLSEREYTGAVKAARRGVVDAYKSLQAARAEEEQAWEACLAALGELAQLEDKLNAHRRKGRGGQSCAPRGRWEERLAELQAAVDEAQAAAEAREAALGAAKEAVDFAEELYSISGSILENLLALVPVRGGFENGGRIRYFEPKQGPPIAIGMGPPLPGARGFRGGDSPAARAGRCFHEILKRRVKKKEGWQPEPRLVDPKTGKIVIPDTVTRTGRPLELKPNTPSGRKAGKTQLKQYERATGKKGRVIYHGGTDGGG